MGVKVTGNEVREMSRGWRGSDDAVKIYTHSRCSYLVVNIDQSEGFPRDRNIKDQAR